jgi:hypothetical protein
MRCMPRSGQDPRHFAEEVERRARLAWGYLALFGVVMTLILVALLW